MFNLLVFIYNESDFYLKLLDTNLVNKPFQIRSGSFINAAVVILWSSLHSQVISIAFATVSIHVHVVSEEAFLDSHHELGMYNINTWQHLKVKDI